MQILQKAYSADQEHSNPKSDFSGLGLGEGSDFVTLLQCNLAREDVFCFLVSLLQASLHFKNKSFTKKRNKIACNTIVWFRTVARTGIGIALQ